MKQNSEQQHLLRAILRRSRIKVALGSKVSQKRGYSISEEYYNPKPTPNSLIMDQDQHHCPSSVRTTMNNFEPCLRASTQNVYSNCAIQESWRRENWGFKIAAPAMARKTNVFKTCEWSADGSSLVSTSEDQVLRVFAV